MKNLNKTLEKAAMPNLSPVSSVNRKFIYSLCAALFLLTCSLTTNAKPWYRSLPGYGYGFYYGSFLYTGSGTSLSDPAPLNYDLGFSSPNSTDFQQSACTSCSPFTNVEGGTSTGNDKYIQINVIDAGYLNIVGGTSDFDSIFYLYDSSGNLVTSSDDGEGAGDNIGHSALQPHIEYAVITPDTYYLRVDGHIKYSGSNWTSMSGTVNIEYYLL